MSDLFTIECEPIAQSFIGITVTRTDELIGYTTKISNIKFNLGEILKNAVIMSLQAVDGSAISYLLILVEMVSALYNKSKQLLTQTDCAVLLTLYNMTSENVCTIDEDTLKVKTLSEYPDIEVDDFTKSINKLLHLECIDIVKGNIILNEIVNVRYDF